MPRGFLVKRYANIIAYSYRPRRNSDEDASDSGSEKDYPVYSSILNSPADSGYGQSPLSLPSIRSISKYSSPTRSSVITCVLRNDNEKSNRCENNNILPPIRQEERNAAEKDKRVDGHAGKGTPKPKAARKITFDDIEDLTSPVSGTVIRPLSDSDDEGHVSGDIDCHLNWVDISPEARAKLERINNNIGDYACMLCKEMFEDAFKLAQHKCSRIIYVEYRCPECDKVFNCPANLASHRRWHKPRPVSNKPNATRRILPSINTNDNENEKNDKNDQQPTNDASYVCETCGREFKRQAYLRKHLNRHQKSLLKESTATEESKKEKESECCIRNSDKQEEYGFLCSFCPERYSSAENLSVHLENSHPKHARYVFVTLPVPEESH